MKLNLCDQPVSAADQRIAWSQHPPPPGPRPPTASFSIHDEKEVLCEGGATFCRRSHGVICSSLGGSYLVESTAVNGVNASNLTFPREFRGMLTYVRIVNVYTVTYSTRGILTKGTIANVVQTTYFNVRGDLVGRNELLSPCHMS